LIASVFLFTNSRQINGEPRPSDEVDGLSVSVSSSVAYLHAEDPIPEFIAAQTYPEVTVGRAGGIDA